MAAWLQHLRGSCVALALLVALVPQARAQAPIEDRSTAAAVQETAQVFHQFNHTDEAPFYPAGPNTPLACTENMYCDFDNCLCEPSAVSGPFGSGEFLLIRPHFSEAIAFARGTQTLGPTISQRTEGVELDFAYDASLRAIVGYRSSASGAELRFTYSRLQGDVRVVGAAGAGEFLVDPFGNGVGTLVVIDPHSALAGVALPTGDLIQTRATVDMNVYDLEVAKALASGCNCGELAFSVGVRLADVNQFYESIVTQGGNFFAGGDFSADFLGAGLRLGARGQRRFGTQQRFGLSASGNAALLVGQYEVDFNNRTTIAPAFVVNQNENVVRTLPVMEGEIAAQWHPMDQFTVSAGWLFQAWFDLGASGGQFGGFFSGADDANIMSFDGAFVKIEATF